LKFKKGSMEVHVHNKNLTWKEKKRQHGQDKILRDCFYASLIYGDGLSRKNHRMKWTLFLGILDNVYAHDSYFCKNNMHLAT